MILNKTAKEFILQSYNSPDHNNNKMTSVKCINKRKNKIEFLTFIFLCVFILLITASVCNCERAHHKRIRHSKIQQQRQHHHSNSGANKLSRFHETAAKYNQQHQEQQEQNGLWPRIFNVAKYARITANATCGTTIHGREEFCRLAVELNRNRKSGNACGICDRPGNPDPSKQHPIENVISNSDDSATSGAKWWQSPTLAQGPEYEFVTITLDLRQIFQITYVIVKAGNSPRPGTWVLERSMDGENFLPWQYYAVTDEECWDRFGIEPTPGKPKYKSATDVICTSYYSKLIPLENGEIHTSLKLDRPGANETSPEYLEFTLARYVRLRFLRLRAAVATETTSTLQQQKWFTYSEGPRARLLPATGLSEHEWHKRLYYSIRDINIGGLCVCNGHARQCLRNNVTEIFECQCEHNTCGIHCEYCCPLYNQMPYETGYRTHLNPTDFNHNPALFECESCQCFGHAQECQYDPEIAINKESLDITGRYRGGGICINCTKFTTGFNCQDCIEGYYRPSNRNPDHSEPCIPCDCHPAGSMGDCLREAFLEDENVGDCICKLGYTGPRCSMCADGYRGFPNCELCPCDPRGTISGIDCEGTCNCKINVEGPTCSRCKSGYFALQAQNPDGCLACYCSGVSNTCESNIPIPQIFETLEGWLVTDISITSTVKPIFDMDTNFLIINNDDFAETEAYYWLAPTLYLGNKLEAYGSHFILKLNWDVMRGDRSGKPTTGPDLILVGANGLKIAYGDCSYTSENATLHIALTEKNWYHVPDDVKDIVTRLRRTEYRGDLVTRAQFLSVLADLKHVLIRAKFHTDQSESALERVLLEIQPDEMNLYQSMVEKCACPTGYTGLSCENCDYGYVKMNLNFSTHIQQIQCVKCDCHGHSRTCDLQTGQCECEHNTIGEKCERCAVGYYGSYPLYGIPDDCKRCACPLEEASNNFSPSCQMDILELVDGNEATDDDRKVENYVCTQCPQGYTGDHCEICDDGYFGNPIVLGSKCEPCECGGGPCDHLTGQCLKCRGNTEGWKCDRCKPGHYGDPKTANCKPCQCDSVGALSDQCDPITGKCDCRERFAGLTCGECEPGFGNVTADCVACKCDSVGAVSAECHPVTGMCQCRPGVEGFRCDACQHLYYGLSAEGCKSCGCNLHGSELATCDIVTGKCRCKPHVIGRICDRCEYGFWNIKSNRGCASCDCDDIGSINKTCNIETGQCFCKPGVGGMRCDTCLDRYYEFSENGCKECEYCVKPGHVCDPDTGRCVCPPFSHGEICNKCIPNAWGFEPHKGCKPCHCDSIGSFRSQCDPFTGQCSCRDGYTGNRCNKCSPGFYGFPRCRRCNCNLQGTSEQSCDVVTGICSCNDQGFCDCKANVVGKKCDTCKDGTFGLEKNNPEGCTPCFCFGRSTRCTQAGLTWGQIRLKNSRTLKIEKVIPPRRPTNNIAYISHTKFRKPTYGNLYSTRNNIEVYPIDISYLNSTKGLTIIPETDGNITIGAYEPFQTPLYWRLPDTFYGDRVVSYGGYLQFKTFTETNNIIRNFPQTVLNQYPLVLIKGNGITLAHYPLFHGKYEIRFHESLWNIFHGIDVPFNFRDTRVTRNLLMIVLQNVQEILIRATDVEFYTKAVLLDVTMDTAILVSGQPPPLAKGVELCDCPKQYNASSCQNPSIGFYRHYPNRTIQIDGTIIIDTSGSDITSIIGDVIPCSCNSRSTTCDIETGFCTNCEKYTSGNYCDICAEGYYGHPDHDDGCLPCPCPTSAHNFARGCHQDTITGAFRCVCKEGYSGRHCEDCSLGYYRNPLTGTCNSCHCHVYGRASEECDQITGQCNCKSGFNGTDCSKCEAYRHILDHNRCVPADNCTLQLLEKLDEMNVELERNTEKIKDGKVPAPYPILQQIERTVNEKRYEIEQIQNATTKIFHFPLKSLKDLLKRMKLYEKNVQMLEHESHNSSIKAAHVRKKSEKLQKKIQHINSSLHESIQMLNRFIDSDRHVNIKKAVRNGYHLLEQINNVDFTNELSEVTLILYDCQQLLKKLTKINSDLNDFTNRYEDIRQIIDSTIEKIAYVERRNNENRINLDILSNKTDIIDTQKMNIEDVVGDNKFFKRLQNLINDLENIYNDMENGLNDLDDLTLDLNKSQLNSAQLNDLQNQVKKATDHAEYLNQLADSYEDKFKATKDKAVKSVEASQVYKNIRNSLYEAYEAAKNASRKVDSVNEFLYPEYDKSLMDRTVETLQNSNRVKHKAETQKHRVDKLRDRQLHLNLTIDSVKDTLWTTGVQDNNISKTLTEFNSSITNSMEMVLQEATKISNDMKNLYNRAKQIQDDKAYKLLPSLNDLTATQGNISVYFSSIEEKLTETQTSKDNLEARLQSIHIMAMNQRDIINRWNNSLIDKLQTLKNKVDQARRLASEVQIPLTSKNEYRCTRVYRPYTVPMGNSTATTISFVLSLIYDIQNSPLIYIGGTNQHFIAVEMVNRKIRLLWQLGDDVGIVVHPETIEKLTENTGYYYNIQIERIRNIGTLSVRKKFLANGTTVSSDDWKHPETKTTNPKYTILNSGTVNDVWVGGVPNRATEMYPELLKSQGLAVSIYDLVLNENPIGLWNYHETEKSACQSDTYWTYTLNEYQFNGAGYSVKEIKNQFASLRMSITLTFKTFDEDALIIAVVSPKNNSFLSISLEGGHLVYFVQYVGESQLKIVTEEKYNTGKLIKIEGSREFNRKKQENAILKINNQKVYRSNPDIPVRKDQLPDLKMAKYYLGGLSPLLIHNIKYMVSTFKEYQSMLGCMFEIQVDQKRIDPVDAEHDGVEYSCSQRTLNRVGFLGDGYIKLGLPSANKIQSFSFIFNTQRENGLLALVNLNMEQSKDTSYILVRLKAGQIECEIRQGKLSNILLTNENYNDGMTHVFSLSKDQKHTELRVDDQLKDQLAHKIQGYADIIYFGGYPNKIFGDVTINEPTFEGTIQDVIINNELILFNSPLAFERVRIGRDGPTFPKVSPLEIGIAPLSMSTLDEGACNNQYINLTYERGALKLGDAPYSHVQHPLNIADFWKKNFRLEFEFRTFYPNGMLFVSPGLQKGKQRHHILLQIKNGTVYLSIKGRRKRELHLPIVVNDGIWHRVQIQSTNMKWTLSIDNITSHAQKRPKKLNVANKIYVGAWPEYENRLPASLVQDLQTFKGCVRRLQINGHLRDLTSNKTNDAVHNTGECFPQIERGSYFNGNAYAIYRKNFQLPTSFEFSLEFKTSQLNGILLTSGGSNNPPLLSLELNNGRVILSAQINYEKPVHVDVALPSPYDICNNKWHHIRGFYSENEPIVIKIDDITSTPSYVSLGEVNNQIRVNLESALYIGGLPDSVPSGTLQTRESFHGCLRNIVIGNKKSDWLDMDELQNVLLNSCPTI